MADGYAISAKVRVVGVFRFRQRGNEHPCSIDDPATFHGHFPLPRAMIERSGWETPDQSQKTYASSIVQIVVVTSRWLGANAGEMSTTADVAEEGGSLKDSVTSHNIIRQRNTDSKAKTERLCWNSRTNLVPHLPSGPRTRCTLRGRHKDEAAASRVLEMELHACRRSCGVLPSVVLRVEGKEESSEKGEGGVIFPRQRLHAVGGAEDSETVPRSLREAAHVEKVLCGRRRGGAGHDRDLVAQRLTRTSQERERERGEVGRELRDRSPTKAECAPQDTSADEQGRGRVVGRGVGGGRRRRGHAKPHPPAAAPIERRLGKKGGGGRRYEESRAPLAGAQKDVLVLRAGGRWVARSGAPSPAASTTSCLSTVPSSPTAVRYQKRHPLRYTKRSSRSEIWRSGLGGRIRAELHRRTTPLQARAGFKTRRKTSRHERHTRQYTGGPTRDRYRREGRQEAASEPQTPAAFRCSSMSPRKI
ncbi:hypothetical protein BCR34DRAFT_633509 [Clohesyomyces aquaticus]|uniref:Uncharacterized protein n=1 Tax=Clohesyomyces aquaticus TaxID=1231657 RepID=A0A1Y2A482_9PLEO|nr:hypothetical protein BCR34DRAFT_633509 [Clohesyomyces aquaticus]